MYLLVAIANIKHYLECVDFLLLVLFVTPGPEFVLWFVEVKIRSLNVPLEAKTEILLYFISVGL